MEDKMETPQDQPAGSAPQVAPAGSPAPGDASPSILDQLMEEDARGADSTQADTKGKGDIWSEVRKALDNPESLPEDLRGQFLRQSDYTKKTQQLAEERRRLEERDRRFYDRVMEERERALGRQTTPDERSQMLEEIRSGNFDKVADFLREEIKGVVEPVVSQTALRNAIEQGTNLHPWVQEKGDAIYEVIAQDPELERMVKQDNYRMAPRVFAALAFQLEALTLREQVKNHAAAIENAKREGAKALLAELKAKGAVLPPATSRAGGPVSAGAAPSDGMEFKEAVRAAIRQMGKDPGPFL